MQHQRRSMKLTCAASAAGRPAPTLSSRPCAAGAYSSLLRHCLPGRPHLRNGSTRPPRRQQADSSSSSSLLADTLGEPHASQASYTRQQAEQCICRAVLHPQGRLCSGEASAHRLV